MKCFGNRLGRRGFLTVGAVGGFTLADFFRAKAIPAGFQKTKDQFKVHKMVLLDGGSSNVSGGNSIPKRSNLQNISKSRCRLDELIPGIFIPQIIVWSLYRALLIL